jgi:hypothetical protein
MEIVDCGCHGCATCKRQDDVLETTRERRVALCAEQADSGTWSATLPMPCFDPFCGAVAKVVDVRGRCLCYVHSTVAEREAFEAERFSGCVGCTANLMPGEECEVCGAVAGWDELIERAQSMYAYLEG